MQIYSIKSEGTLVDHTPRRVDVPLPYRSLLLLGHPYICMIWQELSHWPSMLSRENPSAGQGHAGLIRGPPAINQREQCILGGGSRSYLTIA